MTCQEVDANTSRFMISVSHQTIWLMAREKWRNPYKTNMRRR